MVLCLGRWLYCVCRRSSYGGRKRSRSQGRVLDRVEEGGHEESQETVANSMARKAEEQEAASKRQKSSTLAKPQAAKASYAATPVGRRTRSCLVPKVEDSPAGHEMQQKTVLKSEKCVVCAKRMKFGKIVLRCAVCKVGVHQECALRVPVVCGGGGLSPTLVSRGLNWIESLDFRSSDLTVSPSGEPEPRRPPDSASSAVQEAILRLANASIDRL